MLNSRMCPVAMLFVQHRYGIVPSLQEFYGMVLVSIRVRKLFFRGWVANVLEFMGQQES